MQTTKPQSSYQGWTLEDDNTAWLEGWWIGPSGFVGYIDDALGYVSTLAADGSDLHIRALQHVALCKLTNVDPSINPFVTSWTRLDNEVAEQEGWYIENRELRFSKTFWANKEILDSYLLTCAKQGSKFHIRALRNTLR